jgi:hypothetical protein
MLNFAAGDGTPNFNPFLFQNDFLLLVVIN